jgi:hypothetical protein
MAAGKRQKILFDFSSAKTIGIICASVDEPTVRILKDFLHFLSQKHIQYQVLGYFNMKKIPENYLYWKEMDFFTQKDLNFFFIPHSPAVDKFIDHPFDMLINCSMEKYFPVNYVMGVSQAKCKVGIGNEEENDLSLDIKKKEIGYYLENVKLYLTNLRISEA